MAFQGTSKLFQELVLKSWWTILFFLLCFFAYDQASGRKKQELEKLQDKLAQLNLTKKEALTLQQELKRELASQDDDCWIELVLMKRLGLVPEGHTKILFIHKNGD